MSCFVADALVVVVEGTPQGRGDAEKSLKKQTPRLRVSAADAKRAQIYFQNQKRGLWLKKWQQGSKKRAFLANSGIWE
jgi:hypothetical protein